MLVALLALAIATGGTSYAAVKVTSKDIRNRTITLQDLSPKAVAQLRGSSGAPGAAGAAGADGRDATDVLTSGTTVTGSVHHLIGAGAASQALRQSIALPARAPAPMSGASFAPGGSAATSDDDPACLGSYAQPTAPAGLLCAYSAGTSNAGGVSLSPLGPGQDKGFVVRLTSVAAGTVSVDFSWAYTAPDPPGPAYDARLAHVPHPGTDVHMLRRASYSLCQLIKRD